MQQVALQALQQTVAVRAVVVALFGIGVGRDLAGGVHHFVAAEHADEIAAGRAPGLQQRVVGFDRAERIAFLRAQALSHRLQIAPVRAGRGRHIEMQHTDPGLSGDHPQDVRRNIERGEGEQPWRQPGRKRDVAAARLSEAREIVVDAARPVRAPAGDTTPQRRLRIARRLPCLPAQQPVAAPGLVFLEHRCQLSRQRPRFQRIVATQVSPERLQGRFAQDRRIGERRVQLPAQGVRAQVVCGTVNIGVERALHELAGRQEFQIGGDAVFGRERGLQPAPHRHLRNQHDIRHQ